MAHHLCERRRCRASAERSSRASPPDPGSAPAGYGSQPKNLRCSSLVFVEASFQVRNQRDEETGNYSTQLLATHGKPYEPRAPGSRRQRKRVLTLVCWIPRPHVRHLQAPSPRGDAAVDPLSADRPQHRQRPVSLSLFATHRCRDWPVSERIMEEARTVEPVDARRRLCTLLGCFLPFPSCKSTPLSYNLSLV